MITIKQQKILLEFFLIQEKHKQKGLIREEFLNRKFDDKKLLSNDADFFKQIKILTNFGYIAITKSKNNNICYCLTDNGWAFINIIAMQFNTPKKYNKIARVITWLP